MIRETIRQIRNNYGWSQLSMADVIGTKREAYNRKERGKSHFESHELVRIYIFFQNKVGSAELTAFETALEKEGRLNDVLGSVAKPESEVEKTVKKHFDERLDRMEKRLKDEIRSLFQAFGGLDTRITELEKKIA